MATRTAWIPTAATGEEVSQTDFRSIPGGLVGHASITSNQGPITTEVDVTGLTVTVNLVASRLYRVDAIVHATPAAASVSHAQFSVDDGVNRFQIAYGLTSGSTTQALTFNMTALLVGDDAAHDIQVRAAGSGGSGITVLANAQFPCLLLVTDVGPSF